MQILFLEPPETKLLASCIVGNWMIWQPNFNRTIAYSDQVAPWRLSLFLCQPSLSGNLSGWCHTEPGHWHNHPPPRSSTYNRSEFKIEGIEKMEIRFNFDLIYLPALW